MGSSPSKPFKNDVVPTNDDGEGRMSRNGAVHPEMQGSFVFVFTNPDDKDRMIGGLSRNGVSPREMQGSFTFKFSNHDIRNRMLKNVSKNAVVPLEMQGSFTFQPPNDDEDSMTRSSSKISVVPEEMPGCSISKSPYGDVEEGKMSTSSPKKDLVTQEMQDSFVSKSPNNDKEYMCRSSSKDSVIPPEMQDSLISKSFHDENNDEDRKSLSSNKFDIQSQESFASATSLSSIQSSDSNIYVTATPPKKLRSWKIEDTYWSGKKSLMPDRDRLQVLDKHAVEAPQEFRVPVQTSPEDLVQYLTQPARNDVEKLRCIVRWIGENIDYEVDYYNKPGIKVDGSLEAVLRTGKAVCEGYAVVVQGLCRLASMECSKISGISKAVGYYPGSINNENVKSDHAWNIVKIGGNQYFVESTWAAGSSDTSSGMMVYKRSWKESWFLTDPKEFVGTHLPIKDKVNIDVDTQLLQNPYTNLKEWATQIMQHPLAMFFGLDPLTHPKSEFAIEKSEFTIQFKNPYAMDVFHKVKRVFESGNSRYLQDLEGLYSMAYNVDKKHVIDFRLPGKGKYQLEIAFQFTDADELDGAHRVAIYVVDNLDSTSHPIYPQGSSNQWGVLPLFSGAGFKLVSPKQPIIKATNGKATIKIKSPTKAWFPAVYDLTMSTLSNDTITTFKYNDFVYPERNEKEVTFFINTPKEGEYKFSFGLKPSDDGEILEGFTDALCILISSDKPAQTPIKFNTNRIIAGPNFQFYKMGLQSSSKSSTLQVIEGKAELKITKTAPMSFHAKLVCAGLDDNVVKNYLSESTKGDTTTYIVKPKQDGVYLLKLLVAEEGTKTYSYEGLYIIPYNVSI